MYGRKILQKIPKSEPVSSIQLKNGTEISNSFIPRYNDGKSPWEKEAKIYKLAEWTKTLTKEQLSDHARRFKVGVIVTTAYNTVLNTRLVVDGLKRSSAIQDRVNNSEAFPPVTVRVLWNRCGQYFSHRI